MATITPFGALRFTKKAGEIGELACPPYDIISEAEREAYLAQNPHNIIRLELPRDGADPYANAGKTLRSWLDGGILACDGAPGYYLYEEEFTVLNERKKVRGLVCRVRLEPFSAGVVLPHEETLSKAKDDRLNLMKATNSNFSSIYSLYSDENRSIAPLLSRWAESSPEVEFSTADGIIHRVWPIRDENAIAEISCAFKDKKIYIADGHHRYETALNYKSYLTQGGQSITDSHPAAAVMMTLVDMENEGLVVFPTHRIVRDLPDFDYKEILRRCEAYFDIERLEPSGFQSALDCAADKGKKAFVLYVKNEAVCLTLANAGIMDEVLAGMSAAYRELDVSILHTLILEKLLGIDKENMMNQRNLTYTRDPLEAIAAVDAGSADCAFLINPTKVSEIADVAGAGEKMPQKSTYFYPKLITGHLMNPLF